MTRFKTLAFCASLAMTASAADAVTYDINRTIGAGTVTGFIETNGTIGSLATGDIDSFSLTLTSPNISGGTPQILNDSNGTAYGVFGFALVGSATALTFDFDATGPAGTDVGLAFIQPLTGAGWCLVAVRNCSTETLIPGEGLYTVGLNNVAENVARSGVVTLGTVAAVPLPASLPLSLLGVGAMVAVSRRRKQC